MIKKILNLFVFLSVTAIFAQQSYYNDVNLNLTGSALKDALATKITVTHTHFLSYSDVWEADKVTDVNPANNSQVLLIYGYEDGSDGILKNDRTRDKNSNGGALTDWNREHVYAKSLGTPALGTSGPGADAHHLRPADPAWNSTRNNRKFTDGSGHADKVGDYWFPGDEWKGDVARMMMYMYLRYGNRCLPTNIGVGSSAGTPDDMIDLFLKWNVEDPVSDFERARNTYHENTSNQYAQGNRNPFIDEPYLATRIWGGSKAEDTWGIYTSSDTEAPTVPTNVILSNITTSSIKVSWTAATDNVAVTSYDIFVDGNLATNVTTTSAILSNLTSNTTFSITVLAKDIVSNKSAQTSAVQGTTLVDNTAPSVPTNIAINNETDVSFKITWDAATDDTAVTGYDIFLDNNYITTTTETTYTANGLTKSTTYTVTILAKDAVDNKSAQSVAVNAVTTDGTAVGAAELFFSEYIEGSSNNKALELTNPTNTAIDLTGYSIKRQSNGAGEWANKLDLTGSLPAKSVYVLVNSQADAELTDLADFIVLNTSPNYGAPVNFNGNDPVGLFYNDILIDIIGTFDGGASNFAKDVTLRRKSTVASPNTTFDETNEWDQYPIDTFDNLGVINTTLGVNDFNYVLFKMYPNPLSGNILHITQNAEQKINQINIFNSTGKKVMTINKPTSQINIKKLHTGLYLLQFISNKKIGIRKLIKQ